MRSARPLAQQHSSHRAYLYSNQIADEMRLGAWSRRSSDPSSHSAHLKSVNSSADTRAQELADNIMLDIEGDDAMGVPRKAPAEHGAFKPQLRACETFNRSRGQPFMIGVAGGTASGKTTVCDRIMQRMHDQCVVMLALDSFYRCLSPEEHAVAHECNFDHPDAFDVKLLLETLRMLKARQPVDIPVYDFATHQRTGETRRVQPADVVIVEGILVLHMEEIREQLNMAIYLDTDDDVRLARRIQRDIAMRGRDVAGVLDQYTKFVKPAFDQYIAPSKRHADLIIPWQRGENIVAIDLITEHIRLKLKQHHLVRIYPNLTVIPSNYQSKGLHTIIRSADTQKNDFVFYADRLNRLVVEAGLGHLPFEERTVTTPTGHTYVGVDFAKRLCGVSIIRGGEAMENALRACCKGIKIGKILIERARSSVGSGGSSGCSPGIVYEKLPPDIADRHVLLMDPVLCTGEVAMRSIQVLLAKGVRPERILFLCVIAAPEGITRLCSAHPDIKVVVSEIDESVDADSCVVPGVGLYGDRYYS